MPQSLKDILTRYHLNTKWILMPLTVHYNFSQRFNAPARKAYQWCTDYTPEDQALMQEENATREIHQIAKDVLILTDTYLSKNERTTKQKLVCLYPHQLSWTSTHITGPNKYSQFLYQIVTEGKARCRLHLTALTLIHDTEAADKKETKKLAQNLKKTDSETWKRLAKIMENELKEKCRQKPAATQPKIDVC